MILRASAVAPLLVVGCFSDVGSSGAPVSDGSSSSGADEETGGPPSDSSGLSTTTSTSDDPTSETSSDDASTGTPPDPSSTCWGSNAPWTTEVLDLDRLGAQSPTALTLTPDGRALHFAAGSVDARVPYRSERPDRESSFGVGVPISDWTAPPGALDQLRIAEFGGRAVTRVGAELHAAVVGEQQWGPLQPAITGPGFEELSDPTLDAAGRVLIFVRRETHIDGGGMESRIWAPYRVTWADDEPLPAARPERLQLPSFDLEHAQLCPTLSPDGEHLLIGGSFPQTWDSAVVGDLDVFESRSAAGAWTEPSRQSSLSSTEQHACPLSVTADGCEATVRHFDIPFQGNTFVLARRVPESP